MYWVQLHLLESRHVHYICQASIIHQHSSGVVPFNGQHNDKGVIVWLLEPLHILLGKNNVVILCMMMFCCWMFDMNTVYLPLDCLSQGLV